MSNKDMLLKIKDQALKIQKQYESNPRTQSFNAIIHGPIKVGKTSLAKTCPAPVLIHSFDPGGTDPLRAEIATGQVIADTRFEEENPYAPQACRLWEEEFNRLRRMGFFSHVGTFIIDSMTTWAQVIMYEVIRRAHVKKPAKRVIGGSPQQDDWLPQMQFIENYMRLFLSLPCPCILMGHSDQPKDQDGNILGDEGIMITGKLRQRVPALFSEIYYMRIKNYQTGERELLTQPTYGIQTGSRLGSGGKLNKTEEPNIKNIMKKVGLDPSDKPMLDELVKED